MSQSHALQVHIVQMEEIRTILNSMKNLALIEIHKLGRMQPVQSQLVAHLQSVAQDFLSFYPQTVHAQCPEQHLAILLGAERGFCGDFNSSVLQAVKQEQFTGLIALGNQLCNRLSNGQPPVLHTLAGANVAEEIPTILQQLIDTLNDIAQHSGLDSFKLSVLFHASHHGPVVQQQLLPPFIDDNQRKVTTQIAPLLNIPPADFFRALVHEYLFGALHEIFYLSLIAENHRRLQHLEGAVKHLEEETLQLRRKSQIYRQEEITEEIEVILLNAENQ